VLLLAMLFSKEANKDAWLPNIIDCTLFFTMPGLALNQLGAHPSGGYFEQFGAA
jgi:hypothetical protein